MESPAAEIHRQVDVPPRLPAEGGDEEALRPVQEAAVRRGGIVLDVAGPGGRGSDAWVDHLSCNTETSNPPPAETRVTVNQSLFSPSAPHFANGDPNNNQPHAVYFVTSHGPTRGHRTEISLGQPWQTPVGKRCHCRILACISRLDCGCDCVRLSGHPQLFA